MLYDLDCRYDSRASFYGKAKVRVCEESENITHLELLSYGTLVANYVFYKKENKKVYEYFGNYSQTTTRHQKEFFRQNGLSDKEIKELFKNDRLEKEF
jgi:homoserine trans-succinylase